MTTHLQSEQIDEGLNRRGLVKALAAGAAAASVATPSLAQPAAVLAEATSADYVRDPTHWGSAEVAALFPGFKHLDIRTKGAVIRLRHGGSGPPLLLLHGNSQNHATWSGVAARLAERYHVVLADLRGYGDSSLPDPGPNHINYSSAFWRGRIRRRGQPWAPTTSARADARYQPSHARSAEDAIMKVCILDVPSSHLVNLA